jgi:hypothetical protein
MHSRPDILFATSICTTKTSNPTLKDLAAVNRIISYLVRTKDLALKLGSNEGIVLYGTVDASYATHGDSKSHTGFTLHISKDSGAVMATSKKTKNHPRFINNCKIHCNSPCGERNSLVQKTSIQFGLSTIPTYNFI